MVLKSCSACFLTCGFWCLRPWFTTRVTSLKASWSGALMNFDWDYSWLARCKSSRAKSWWKLHELSASCLLSCWRLTWLKATTLSLSALDVGTLHREAMPAKVAQVSSSSSWALDLWDPTHKVARMFLEWFLAVDYSDWFQRPSHPSSSDPTSASTLAASPMLPVEMTNSASASKSRAASQTTRSVKLVNQVNSARVAQSEAAQPRVLWLATKVRLKAINPR